MNYDEVPNMISGKDLDYLTDIFNWNYGAYKCAFNANNEVLDKALKKHLNKSSKVFYNAMRAVLEVLESGESDE
jgi:hypothetical protein